jgi:hypothetical protein
MRMLSVADAIIYQIRFARGDTISLRTVRSRCLASLRRLDFGLVSPYRTTYACLCLVRYQRHGHNHGRHFRIRVRQYQEPIPSSVPDYLPILWTSKDI